MGEVMKEREVMLGIILVVTGSILMEINGNIIINVLSLVPLSLGVILYIKTVDSLDKTKKKKQS